MGVFETIMVARVHTMLGSILFTTLMATTVSGWPTGIAPGQGVTFIKPITLEDQDKKTSTNTYLRGIVVRAWGQPVIIRVAYPPLQDQRRFADVDPVSFTLGRSAEAGSVRLLREYRLATISPINNTTSIPCEAHDGWLVQDMTQPEWDDLSRDDNDGRPSAIRPMSYL